MSGISDKRYYHVIATPHPPHERVTLSLGNAAEDQYLATALGRHFDVTLQHVLDPDLPAKVAPLILIRNIWTHAETLPELHAYVAAEEANIAFLADPNYATYNPVSHPDEHWDKRYLLRLFEEGYPVIPTIADLADLPRLGSPAAYFCKPRISWDGVGAFAVSPSEVVTLDLTDRLLQPRINLIGEVSFYFVDGELIYALATHPGGTRWDLTHFTPTPAERAFAARFWQQRAMPYGILRVDALRLPDGSLLLTELEGNGAYLSLEALADPIRELFIGKLATSLKKLIR